MANTKTRKSRLTAAKQFSPKRFSRATYVGLVLMFAAFSGVGYRLLTPSSAATLTTRDVAFCNDEYLDFYGPLVKKYARAPLIIYIHGGYLLTGDKTFDTTQISFLNQLQNRGYALAAINYHFLTEAPNTTAPIDDTLCAIRFVRANAVALGIDPTRIGLFGWSAGAQLAALADTLPSNSGLNKGSNLGYSSKPEATVALAGAYDFNWELANPLSSAIDLRNRALSNLYQGMAPTNLQPYNLISADDPPILFIHGQADDVVNPVHTDRMDTKATQVGARHQVIRVARAGHGLEPNDNSIAPTQTQVNASIASFFDSNLQVATAAIYVPPAAKPKPAPAPVAKPVTPNAPATSTNPTSSPAANKGISAGSNTTTDASISTKPSTDKTSTIDDISRDSEAAAATTKTKKVTGWVLLAVALLAAVAGTVLWRRHRFAKQAENEYDSWYRS